MSLVVFEAMGFYHRLLATGLATQGAPLARVNLRQARRFAELFQAAQSAGYIDKALDPKVLARRYQSDLLGLRVSAEREGVEGPSCPRR